jgi:putative PIN family toxin of toxin-antitoxin system
MRLVFDCNVLIRALLNEYSFSGLALKKAESDNATLLRSIPVLAETIEVITRPKFDQYIPNEQRRLFLEEYELRTVQIKITTTIKICRDPDDDKYLELALSGQADCIITNDPDLLVLNPFQNILILSPKDFIDRF